MIGEVITCEREGCETDFAKRTHNQIYHDAECTRLATNVKITKKYHDKRAIKLGYARYCSSCEAKLSRYNPDTVCGPCTLKKETQRNNSVSDMLSGIAWVV